MPRPYTHSDAIRIENYRNKDTGVVISLSPEDESYSTTDYINSLYDILPDTEVFEIYDPEGDCIASVNSLTEAEALVSHLNR